MTNVHPDATVRNCALGEDLRARVAEHEAVLRAAAERSMIQTDILRGIDSKVDYLRQAQANMDKLFATLAEHVAQQNGHVNRLEMKVSWMVRSAIVMLGSGAVTLIVWLIQTQ